MTHNQQQLLFPSRLRVKKASHAKTPGREETKGSHAPAKNNSGVRSFEQHPRSHDAQRVRFLFPSRLRVEKASHAKTPGRKETKGRHAPCKKNSGVCSFEQRSCSHGTQPTTTLVPFAASRLRVKKSPWMPQRPDSLRMQLDGDQLLLAFSGTAASAASFSSNR